MNFNELQTRVEKAAADFSVNKATNAAYKKIFYLIFNENKVQNNVNEFGFTEISCERFKKISKRKYKDILIHAFNHGLIFASQNLANTRTRFIR